MTDRKKEPRPIGAVLQNIVDGYATHLGVDPTPRGGFLPAVTARKAAAEGMKPAPVSAAAIVLEGAIKSLRVLPVEDQRRVVRALASFFGVTL